MPVPEYNLTWDAYTNTIDSAKLGLGSGAFTNTAGPQVMATFQVGAFQPVQLILTIGLDTGGSWTGSFGLRYKTADTHADHYTWMPATWATTSQSMDGGATGISSMSNPVLLDPQGGNQYLIAPAANTVTAVQYNLFPGTFSFVGEMTNGDLSTNYPTYLTLEVILK
jgi:hypothetical protein